jgi:hypothetical protein
MGGEIRAVVESISEEIRAAVMENFSSRHDIVQDAQEKYRVVHKSLDKNAFKSQILVSNDLWPTLYTDENFAFIRSCPLLCIILHQIHQYRSHTLINVAFKAMAYLLITLYFS